MIQTISLYLLAFLFMFGSFIIARISQKRVILFCLLFFLLILTINRVNLPDLNAYKNVFINSVSYIDLSDFSIFKKYAIDGNLIEGGFLLLNSFIYFFTNNVIYYFAIIAFLELLLFYKAGNRLFEYDYKKIFLLFAFTLPYFGYMYMFVTIREGLAIAVSLNALTIKNNTVSNLTIKSFIYSLAFTIHNAIILVVIIDFLLYFFNKYKIIHKFILILFIFSIFIRTDFFNLLFSSPIIYILNILDLHYYKHYLTYNSFSEIWSLRDILFSAIGLFFIVLHKKIKHKSFNSLLLIFILGLILSNIANNFYAIGRISDIFFFTMPIMLTYIYSNKNIKLKYSYLLILFGIIYSATFVTYFFRYVHIFK